VDGVFYDAKHTTRVKKFMKDHQDAFGHLLYDYLKTGAAAGTIMERDDSSFWISGGPQVYSASYKEWPSYHKRAMRYVRGRVLDTGCGAGRHALHLQQKGFDVLGVDESPLAIEVCKLRGLKQAEVTSITQVSSRLGSFDTILMLGANFGLFGSLDGAKRLLKRFHGITSDRARIIAETRDPYDTDEPIHLEYHERNRLRGRMPGQVRLRVRYKRYATPWFDYLFVSKAEMEKILEGTGWGVRRFIDSGSPAYIAVIAKN
jgi:SAM-dependent methyltransferase